MIERYTLPAMGRLWQDEYRLTLWLKIEIAACEGWAKKGKIPQEAVEVIRQKAAFSWDRVKEIEEVTQHDVLAFLTNVAENVGDEAKYIHLGLTSSDVLDTSLSLQLVEASDILLEKMDKLIDVLGRKALEYKDTLQMGRSHGIHAEPITFGLKFALWYDEMKRQRERLKYAREEIRVGQISGAVGTFANVDPAVEEWVCESLGLKPAPVSTQIIQRDRHAFYVGVLAGIASSLDKIATEIRNLQRTDVHEVEEPFGKGQKGSSAMPHKKNPVISERICGMARLIRGNAQVAFENVALWHERDISHSSAERVILPDSTIALDYMLHKMIQTLEGLRVSPEQMMTNIEKVYGLIFSQRVMLSLVDKGMSREASYALVQKNAMRAWDTKVPFKDYVLQDAEIMQFLTKEEVDALFDYEYHTKNIDYIFRRVGLLK
ncbi:Adenylosuccinate lyase [Dehalobacter sp. UNSWDHB]|uniref:adenylosuccinate lyase n=1 Tax=unclassified Dehalobacter TaxID=2635733 RepID=UPI00028B6B41|nr:MULTISPECIES: adenylosuccinate lyase [unclassified Dehalobacter]AFV03217.1 Adenylosuccinate lyase [Dehalobacter sp. DCA]AFV06203.1 Adenylosuccinate lyase [Dehalobacter sp. CF]EQB20942.1 Adenylosuccinate lyase [Dehalobacter sp. UNSWDHB]